MTAQIVINIIINCAPNGCSLLFSSYFFALSACACRFEVTVTSVSLPPFMSHRGLFNTASSGWPCSPPCSLLALPCVLGGGVSFVAYRAQLGRLGGSRWGWVLQIKYRAIQTNVSHAVKPTFLSSLHPPRLCRIAIFSIKPTFLSGYLCGGRHLAAP